LGAGTGLWAINVAESVDLLITLVEASDSDSKTRNIKTAEITTVDLNKIQPALSASKSSVGYEQALNVY
jgi:hypothetical protein